MCFGSRSLGTGGAGREALQKGFFGVFRFPLFVFFHSREDIFQAAAAVCPVLVVSNVLRVLVANVCTKELLFGSLCPSSPAHRGKWGCRKGLPGWLWPPSSLGLQELGA